MFRDPAFLERVHRMKIEMIARQGMAALLVGYVNVVIFAFAMRKAEDVHYLEHWVAAMALISIGRFALKRYFLTRVLTRPFNPELWENFIALGALCLALGWGYAGVFLLGGHSITNEAFLGFILAGTTSGAVVAYCTSMRTVMAFMLPATLPFAVRLIAEGDPIRHSMAAMLLMYVVIQLVMVSRLKLRLIDALVVNFQKQSLLDELQSTKDLFSQTAKMAALGQMAGAIAHEINNPLAIIRGHNGTLQSKADENDINAEDVKRIAGKIDATIVRMAKIVTGLRTFGRDSHNDAFADVPAEKIVSDTLELCFARFKARSVELRVVPMAKNVSLHCQEVQVSQVLLNLLNNALDAVAGLEGAWVQLELEDELGGVILSVTDSGNGIPEAIREKIMNPFFTTKGAGKGTGLGLSVAFDIMRKHGGTLRIDPSCPNTKFQMFFPREAPLPGVQLVQQS